MGLTAKQSRFIEEYLVDLNATQAAIRAGYSAKTAGAKGFSLLKKVEIAQTLTVARMKRAEKTGVTAEMVLERLWEEGNNHEEGSSHAARVTALSWVGKHHGSFLERVDHTSGGEKLPARVEVVLVRPKVPDDG